MVNTFILDQDKDKIIVFLDDKRLGKSRVEAKQIIDNLEKYDSGIDFVENWITRHPAYKMWIGYTNSLKVYFNICLREWIKRGFNNTMEFYDIDEDKYTIVPWYKDGDKYFVDEEFTEFSFPQWVGFPPFILAHMASLLRKDQKHYSDFAIPELEEYYLLGYLWPSRHSDNNECIYENWDLKYLDPIGEGAPSHFRIPKESALEWSLDKTKNPISGRVISPSGKLYKDYLEASKYYNII